MGRREATAEQKQKAAERRERFRAITARVAAMSDEERGLLVMKCGAVFTCEGRALSPFNTCLVLSQLPTASMVGGFRQWKSQGRSVRKGQHGLCIWVPTGKGETAPAAEEKGEDAKRPGFLMGTVFDISQTEPTEARELATISTQAEFGRD